jgi:protein O-GlcNAc transferase
MLRSLSPCILQLEAAYHGVSPARLLFSKRLKKSDFYSLLSVSDVFLDTRPYNSHTVATDALRGGLPMLTMQGSSFGARVASSINIAAKLDEYLVAYDRKEFDSLGDKWSRISASRPMTQVAKGKLLLTVGKSLFNSTLFAFHAERAYMAMSEVSRLRIKNTKIGDGADAVPNFNRNLYFTGVQ